MVRGMRRGGVVAACVVGVLCSLSWGRYGGGSGTASDPYLIRTAEHLKDMGAYRREAGYAAHYKFVADIDLGKVPMEPMGTEAVRFAGYVDGNGKTISNLRIVASSGNHIGLFGYAEGEFRNLGLINVEINAPASNAVGALVGFLVGGTIERCYVKGGTVAGRVSVGSLVGECFTLVHQCHVSACAVTGQEWVGGLSGMQRGPITQCFSTATVSGRFTIGGLVGCGTRAIRDCYSTAEVVGDVTVGGLIGSGGSEGIIWNCYAAGHVQANWGGGGTAGGLSGGSTSSCSSFWDADVSGPAPVDCGVGMKTQELCKAAMFQGWGRGGAWTIDEGKDYPRLAWENRPGTPLTTPAFPESFGQGTAQQPYVVSTPQELAAIGEFPAEWDRQYRLECDIDLAELKEPCKTIGCYAVPFTGVFDGAGHSISNFRYPAIQSYAALFGAARKAVIRRLTLVNPVLDQGVYSWSGRVAPLIGRLEEGTVEACGVIGGMVGASYTLGGLIGESYRGTITRCYSTCEIVSYHETRDIGGLLGMGERCNINNCYAQGKIPAGERVGGLIGMNYYGSLSHCYSATVVTGGLATGGLIGRPIDTVVTGCFWDTDVSKLAGGTLGTGKSTADLRKAATFTNAGWDFAGERRNGTADIWSIDEGRDYPRFSPEPVAPPQRQWSDDFEDGESEPLWQVYEPMPAIARLLEIDGRLELRAPQVAEIQTSAVRLSDGWAIDCSGDFSLKVDFCLAAASAGEGRVSIGLTPSSAAPVTRRAELAVACLDGQSLYGADRADGLGFGTWWTGRGCDGGTLYLSYDAAADALYLSYTGYGPVNAWRTMKGLLKDRWAGGPVHVFLAGGVSGTEIEPGQAWLDNFTVDDGAILE